MDIKRKSLLIVIIIFLILFGKASSQADTTIYISSTSSTITADSKKPELNILSPNGGEEHDAGSGIYMYWTATDDSFDDTPISIYLSPALGGYFGEAASSIENSGSYNIDLPDVNSAFARFKITAIDHYGNSNVDYSDGYFTIGDPDIWDGSGGGEEQEATLDINGESDIFTGDSKKPELSWLSPNGGEEYGSEETIEVQWQGYDDSFDENPISIYLSENLGKNFNSIAEDIENTESISLNLPAVNSAFARFQVTAVDHFGNTNIDYSDMYFTIGSPTLPDGEYGSNDTTIFFQNESGEFIGDSKSPLLEWLYPNGGEQFDNFETVTVEWLAEDESFGDEAISIYLSTELGGYYDLMEDEIQNTESLDILLPSADEAFARFKATATDLFGNTSEDHGDNYFILGDPFGEYNVNPLDDIVVIDWGWGEYQMIYVDNEALDFMNSGDEIHVIDQNGIITEDCIDEDIYGVVSVSSLPYIPQTSSPYPLYSIGGIDYCSESEYIQPGYIEGNPIYFAHYDESESALNYLEPEYDSGNGLFGFEFQDTLRFKYYDESEGMVYDIFETIIFSPLMIEGDALDPLQLHIDYSTGINDNPQWNVNSGDYQFNGVINSTILNNEQIILDENDRIAAFVNSVCRGTTETLMASGVPFQNIFELQVYGDLPITFVNSFTEPLSRSSEFEISNSISNRTLNEFNVYRNNSLVGESINQFYYLDETADIGQDYCYQIILLDDEGNELLESIEQCIGLEEQLDYISGDVTQDGFLNVLDIVLLVDWILNGASLSDLETSIADITSDGSVNVLDIVALVDTILNP